jgi:hypothetical protein
VKNYPDTSVQASESIGAKNDAFVKTTKAQQKFVWSIATSIISLTTALAEAQDEILNSIIANPSIFDLLFVSIGKDFTPTEIFDDALACLLILSEDNPRLGEIITADRRTQPFTVLLNLKETPGGRGALACGVLHNVFASLQWHDGNLRSNKFSDATLIPTLSKTLQSTSLEQVQTENGHQWSNPVEILQLALEILAAIGTGLQESSEVGSKHEENDEWNGIEEDEDMGANTDDKEQDSDDDAEVDGDETGDHEMDEDEMDAEMEADMEMVTGTHDDAEDSLNSSNLPTLKALAQSAVPEIIRLANLPLNSDAALKVQSHALSALSNTSWSISCFDFSENQNEEILEAWKPAGQSIWAGVISPILDSDTADVELATKVTSLAWAISRSLHGNLPLKGNEHQKFIALYHAAKGFKTDDSSNDKDQSQDISDPFQSIGVKCIGVLGQLALDPAPLPLNREIGVFLMTVLSAAAETPAADIIEALNQIFDIYGDEEALCDQEVFWKDNFLDHLETIQPKIKGVIKGIDKRTMPELRTRVDEAVLNLNRFIHYKKKNRPN